MHYDNGTTASEARATVRALFAILGILSVAAFIGEFDMLYQIRWIVVGLLTLAVLVALLGGLCEVSLVADEKFIELSCCQVMWDKGGNSVYSIEADRLISHRKFDFLFMHFLAIDYVSHRGYQRTARIGLTLVGKRRRDKLMKIIRIIEENNKVSSHEAGSSAADTGDISSPRPEKITVMPERADSEFRNCVKQTTI